MSPVDSDADQDSSEAIEFRVTGAEGVSDAYEASSIEELRLKVAIRNGALYPCILLFTPDSDAPLEDSHELSKLTSDGSAAPSRPYPVRFTKNEELVAKKDMTAKQWIALLYTHLEHGDTSAIERARAADGKFELKVRDRVRVLINTTESFEQMNKHMKEVKTMTQCCPFLGEAIAARGDSGNTLLHQAASVGHTRIMHTLIDAKLLDVDGRNADGRTPLYLAVNSEVHFGAVRILLNAKADASIEENKYGETALHAILATKDVAKCPDVVALLIDAACDVNAVRSNGNTPLHQAVRYADLEIIRILVSAGANCSAKNKNGKTAYEEACDAAVLCFTWDETLAGLERKNALLGRDPPRPSWWEVFRARVRLHLGSGGTR